MEAGSKASACDSVPAREVWGHKIDVIPQEGETLARGGGINPPLVPPK